MKKYYILSSIVILAVIVLLLFNYSSDKKVISDNTYREAFQRNYKIFTPELPQQTDFAGEFAPANFIYVKESLEREILVNTYWHNSTILLLKRANRWFPVIEPILKKNNIPDDFKYLALIESGLMNLVSPRGATGFWQFMDKTAQEYGLEVNKRIDERYHVIKSTEAACKYLNDSYEKFKNWTLVAAAYNAGKRRISESIEDQKVNNYYHLHLNDETSRYVYRILAIKAIYRNPTRYGFYLRESDLYPPIPTREIKVTRSIPDLVTFASNNQVNYKVLKYFNPWLRSNKLLIKQGKEYVIRLPEKGSLDVEKLNKSIKGYDRIFNDTLQVDELSF